MERMIFDRMTFDRSGYRQVGVMHGAPAEWAGDREEGERQFKEWFSDIDIGVHFKFLEVVPRGDQHDLFIGVEDTSIPSIAVKRLFLGVRWFEDVLLNNPRLYGDLTKELYDAYWIWDKEGRDYHEFAMRNTEFE